MGWGNLVAGVAIGVSGGFSTSLAYYVMKRLHNRLEGENISQYFCWEWWLGVLLLLTGALAGIANLGLLGQLAIAPFAAFTLVFNALLGALLLHESYSCANFLSSVIIVSGVVLSATQIHGDREDYTLEDMEDLFSRDEVIIVGCCIIVFIIVSSAVVFFSSAEGHRYCSGGQAPMPEEPAAEPLVIDDAVAAKPFDFSRTCTGLLFYALICGLCSGINSSILKVLVELLKDGGGKHAVLRRLAGWQFWTILFCCLLPGISTQLWTLDQGIKRHTSVLLVPPMTGSIIVCNAAAGHFFFDEGRYYDGQELIVFYAGLIITVSGILLVLWPFFIPGAATVAIPTPVSKKVG